MFLEAPDLPEARVASALLVRLLPHQGFSGHPLLRGTPPPRCFNVLACAQIHSEDKTPIYFQRDASGADRLPDSCPGARHGAPATAALRVVASGAECTRIFAFQKTSRAAAFKDVAPEPILNQLCLGCRTGLPPSVLVPNVSPRCPDGVEMEQRQQAHGGTSQHSGRRYYNAEPLK